MRGILSGALALFLGLALSAPGAAAAAIPAAPAEYYLDQANVLSGATRQYIHDRDYAMDELSGAYIEVVTAEYINMDVLDYSVQLFNKWQIGSADKDNGILLVLVTQEKKYYVTVGKGLEDQISSYQVDQILGQCFEGDFDSGNYDAAVRNTFDRLYACLTKIYGSSPAAGSGSAGSFSAGSGSAAGDSSFGLIVGILGLLALVTFIIAVVFARRSKGRRGDFPADRIYRSHYNPFWYDPFWHPDYHSRYREDGFSDRNGRFGAGGFSGRSGSGGSFGSHSSGGFSGRGMGGGTRGSGGGRR